MKLLEAHRALALLAAVHIAACAAHVSDAPEPLRTGAAKDTKAADAEPPRPNAPDGFVEMVVVNVLPGPRGHLVVLKTEEGDNAVVLPIGIGRAEAMAILLRTQRRRFERPLTHDLLEEILREAGGRVHKVHIDGLESSVFLGTLFVRLGDRLVRIDARPSDSIALALGSRAPIFVARSVLERAGIKPEDVNGANGKKDKGLPL